VLRIRIPKRRGPPLLEPVCLCLGFAPRAVPDAPASLSAPVTLPERARALQLVPR
jgi:hypothetical protein